MKLGLLLCDHIAESWQPEHGDYPSMFAKWLPQVQWTVYDLTAGHFPSSVDSCDAYVTTGSKWSVYDQLPWIVDFKSLVQQLYKARKPYVGICFGHQMLAFALNSPVQKSSGGWCVGNHEFTVSQPQAWMQPYHATFRVLMSCQDQVLSLPEEAKMIAFSEDCPVGVFLVRNYMLGIQGHPEFTVAYNATLIHSRQDRIGLEKVHAAQASFAQPIQAPLLGQWVMKFLEQAMSGQ